MVSLVLSRNFACWKFLFTSNVKFGYLRIIFCIKLIDLPSKDGLETWSDMWTDAGVALLVSFSGIGIEPNFFGVRGSTGLSGGHGGGVE
jgi:hypothetical protein